MKKILLLFLFVFLMCAFVTADLTDGLYSYFPMENHSDILGYAKTGDIGQVSYTPGLIGKALNITTDATNSMIYFGDSVSDRDNTYRDVMFNDSTVNVWVYVREFDSLTSGKEAIFGGSPREKERLGGCTYETNPWEIVLRKVPKCNYDNCPDDTNKVEVSFEIFYYSAPKEIDTNKTLFLKNKETKVEEKSWNMLTMLHIKNKSYKMYFNGIFQETKNIKNEEKNFVINASCPYAIGGRPLITTYGFPFSGQIDELGVWNRALSEGEIKELYNKGKGKTYPFEKEQEVDPLLLKFAPVIKLHPEEYYEFKEISGLMDYSNLMNGEELISGAPTKTNNISNLSNSRDYSMDFVNIDVNEPYDLPDPNIFLNYSPTIYSRIEEDEYGFKHLQYFFFFPFQNYKHMNHEGDWEYVEVILNSANKIHSVTYYFSVFAETYFDNTLLDFFNETHPIVYVAKGSHNTYGSLEPYNFQDIPFFPEDFAEEMLFWEKVFRIVKQTDSVDEAGKTIYPRTLSENGYILEQIDKNTPWANYEGRWGQDAKAFLRKGPRSPQYDARFDNWDLNNYFSVFGDTIIGVNLHSPLNISLLDKQGQVITKASEHLVYHTGPDDPEFIMLKGIEEVTLFLDSYKPGNFSLDIFYYNNNTVSGLLVEYVNLTTYENTFARLNISLNSVFVLQIDLDGDENYESEIYPNKYVVYNGFSLPDRDRDNVTDFEDNCPEISNPEQKDFNEDDKGDACDNPRYYKERALENLETLEAEHRRDKIKVMLAKRNLKQSLQDQLWKDNFDINNKNVFLREHVASRMLKDKEFSKLLAKADSLIVEKKIAQTRLNRKQEKVVEKMYERANTHYKEERYNRAILSYMHIWILLNKKA